MILTLLLVVAFQIGMYQWQKRHQRSYLMVTLTGLWLIPGIIACSLGNILFLVVWAGYFVINALLLRLSLKKPVSTTTPRLIYRFYHGVFQITLVCGALGYICFLANIFLIMSPVLFEYSVNTMFYGVYFGVVSRDMIDLMSDMLASNLGVPRMDTDCGALTFLVL